MRHDPDLYAEDDEFDQQVIERLDEDERELAKRLALFPQFPKPTKPRPSNDLMEEWAWDGYCEATDGCRVEIDGVCPHGHQSWTRLLFDL